MTEQKEPLILQLIYRDDLRHLGLSEAMSVVLKDNEESIANTCLKNNSLLKKLMGND